MIFIKIIPPIPNKGIIIWKLRPTDQVGDWGYYRFNDDEIYDNIIKYFRPKNDIQIHRFINDLYRSGANGDGYEDVIESLKELHNYWLSWNNRN